MLHQVLLTGSDGVDTRVETINIIDDINDYDMTVGHSISAVTVSTVADPGATVVIAPDDADTSTDGHQVNLVGAATTDITVTVGADVFTVHVYRRGDVMRQLITGLNALTDVSVQVGGRQISTPSSTGMSAAIHPQVALRGASATRRAVEANAQNHTTDITDPSRAYWREWELTYRVDATSSATANYSDMDFIRDWWQIGLCTVLAAVDDTMLVTTRFDSANNNGYVSGRITLASFDPW